MTENQKFAGAAIAMIGGTAVLMVALLGGDRTASQRSVRDNSGVSSPQPVGTIPQPVVAPQPIVAAQPVAATAYRSTERYYRDRNGAIASETEVERNFERIRNGIRSMPDNGLRAYREGQLQFLEEEWGRMKRQGPVEPLRAVDSRTGKEILIGEAPLPESMRQRIFYELVQAQDAGVGDGEAFSLISRKYGLPKMMLNEIAYEGAAKKWPMP